MSRNQSFIKFLNEESSRVIKLVQKRIQGTEDYIVNKRKEECCSKSQNWLLSYEQQGHTLWG